MPQFTLAASALLTLLMMPWHPTGKAAYGTLQNRARNRGCIYRATEGGDQMQPGGRYDEKLCLPLQHHEEQQRKHPAGLFLQGHPDS